VQISADLAPNCTALESHATNVGVPACPPESAPRAPLVDATEPNLLEETSIRSAAEDPLRWSLWSTSTGIEWSLTRIRQDADIFITDTTFRDVSRPAALHDRSDGALVRLMAKLGGPTGDSPNRVLLYTKNDRETLDRCRNWLPTPGVHGWIRAVKGTFVCQEAGLKETGMLTSCSDYHIFNKLKFKSRQACLDSYCEVVDAAFEAACGRAVTWKTRPGDWDGFVCRLSIAWCG